MSFTLYLLWDQWRRGVEAGPPPRCVLHTPDRRLCAIMNANLAKDSFDVDLDGGV